ncbi:DUF952 domain-containing protein [Marimonas lutisalis]|uniref:DUF952 domain-containing protein n=1 Tax=Marimonas lutisalis TaxID=2545756 RepID=UPI0010F9DFD8|nr:DUF952 domain-containing protein [Marimonas lutisalis]
MLIYKIFRTDEFRTFLEKGHTAGAPVDLADGFVHLSKGDQVRETAARHFKGEDGLYLLAIDADKLGDALRWEASRGGDLFPHLYRDLRIEDVLWHEPLPLENGVHNFGRLL